MNYSILLLVVLTDRNIFPIVIIGFYQVSVLIEKTYCSVTHLYILVRFVKEVISYDRLFGQFELERESLKKKPAPQINWSSLNSRLNRGIILSTFFPFYLKFSQNIIWETRLLDQLIGYVHIYIHTREF